jgi:hypothetical protein
MKGSILQLDSEVDLSYFKNILDQTKINFDGISFVD